VTARRASFLFALGSAFFLLSATDGFAQHTQGAVPTPEPVPEEPGERPGLIKHGPLYVTPFLRLQSAGLDTNVFYTGTARRVDALAQGGPGLEVVLPMKAVRVGVEGDIDYLYFLRTKSQRHLGGGGRARLQWTAGRLQTAIGGGYSRLFARPSLEVDERVLQESWTGHADLAVSFPGRLQLRAAGDTTQNRVPEAAFFRGTDLQRTLTHDEHRLQAGPRYALTVKTQALLEADLQLDRFEGDPRRDMDSNRVYTGLEIQSATRLFGRVVGGVRFLRPRQGGTLPRQTTPYLSSDLSYRFRPRTLLRTRFERDFSFSAFDTQDAPPTLRNERAEARLEKGLFGRFVIDIFGGYLRLLTSGPITLTTGTDRGETRVRDDKAWSGGADFGYQFRSRIRIGVAATYLDRRSTFADLGIQGLMVGATVRYTPHN
jgi:hypothetical protein